MRGVGGRGGWGSRVVFPARMDRGDTVGGISDALTSSLLSVSLLMITIDVFSLSKTVIWDGRTNAKTRPQSHSALVRVQCGPTTVYAH